MSPIWNNAHFRQCEYHWPILDLSYSTYSILYRKFYIYSTRNLNLNSKQLVSKAANLIFQGLRMKTDIQVFICHVKKKDTITNKNNNKIINCFLILTRIFINYIEAKGLSVIFIISCLYIQKIWQNLIHPVVPSLISNAACLW